jgi:HTH-type transcriptional regulator, transcriptional repressor of NAD biosynthesis genes
VIKKICLYGPESTGKSSLAMRLAEIFNTTFVPEVAREMLVTNDFTVDDILQIGIRHAERIQQQLTLANRILFCDTDVITTQIYSQYYLHVIPEILYQLERETTYDHYFLLDIDVPWVSDGLRDLGHKREEMFEIFKGALESRKIPYTLLQGNFDVREKTVVNWIERNLNIHPEV